MALQNQRIGQQERVALQPNISSPQSALLIKRAVSRVKLRRQKQFREEIRQLREDLKHTRKCRLDPMLLLPEEIWLMIFKNLEDINDIANFKQSCTLFFEMVNSPLQELLFGKILPLVVPYLSYKSDSIVTCGYVCRFWRLGVNRFANTCFSVMQPLQSSLHKLTMEPKPQLDFRKLQRLGHLQVRPELTQRPVVNLKRYAFLVALKINLAIPQVPLSPTNLRTIDTYGDLVWQITFVLGNKTIYNYQQFLRWCAKVLGKCGNLKQFHLCDGIAICPTKGKIFDNETDEQITLKSNSLETLSVLTRKPGILMIQNELVKSLSDQLRILKVRLWNCQMYHTLPWTNLLELEILEDTTYHLLKSLYHMQAPNLYKLSIRLDSSCSLKQLFHVITSFGTLRHLDIQLTKAFVPDLSSVPLRWVARNPVTNLEITTVYLNQGRDLPVLFPNLQNLKWRHGTLISKVAGGFQDSKPKPENLNYCSSSNLHFIQVFKNMYESNVWTVFPYLQNVTLECHSTFFVTLERDQADIETKKTIKDCRSFSRENYIWETEKYFMGVQNCLEEIHSVVRAEKRKILNNERTSFLNVKNVVESHGKQIFQLLADHFTDQDFLVCRLVCSSWKSIVDNLYTQNRTRDFVLKIRIPMTDGLWEDIIANVKNNKNNAFFAHRLQIQIMKKQCGFFINQAQIILETVGKNVRFLTISSPTSPSIVDVYRIYKLCMENCPELKSFTFNISKLKDCRAADKHTMKWNFPKLQKNMKSLITSGPDAYWNTSIHNHFVVNLQRQFCDQITILKQDQCTPKTARTSSKMPNLKELTIRKLDTDPESLFQATWQWPDAPNLEKLHVCVTGQDIGLKELEVWKKQYPKLEFLEMQFARHCHGFTENVINSDRINILKVTQVKLVFKNKYQIRLDFLVFFPLVKILHIVYGKHVSLLSEESAWKSTVSRRKLQRNIMDLPTPRRPTKDFVRLVEYFGDETPPRHNKDKILGSNIWMVLPRLRFLKVVQCSENDARDVAMFNRVT